MVTRLNPASMSVGAVDITLVGMEGASSDDLLTFATDCSSATPDVTPTLGINAATRVTVSAEGTYKLCYQAGGAGAVVEQSGISLTVIAATANNIVTDVVLDSLVAGVLLSGIPTNITLTGASAGASAQWATDCSSAPLLPYYFTEVSASGTGTFTLPDVGTHKLCYRDAGATDSVEQVGVSVTVIQTPSQLSRGYNSGGYALSYYTTTNAYVSSFTVNSVFALKPLTQVSSGQYFTAALTIGMVQ